MSEEEEKKLMASMDEWLEQKGSKRKGLEDKKEGKKAMKAMKKKGGKDDDANADAHSKCPFQISNAHAAAAAAAALTTATFDPGPPPVVRV